MSLGSIPVAEGYIKEAKKASKSSWFSSPEHEIAAQYYEKAAVAYQGANEFQLAYDTFLLAAHSYNKASIIYFTAKAREAAGKVSEKKLKNFEMAGCQYQAASDLYLATGNMPDRAAELMSLAGKMFEDIDINNAIQLHLNSIAIYETENRGRFGIDEFKYTVALLTKNKRYDEAVEVLKRLEIQCLKLNNRFELNKTYLSIIVLFLAKDDDIEAGKQLDQFSSDSGFFKSDERFASDEMLAAYKDFDQEKLDNAIKNQVFYDLNSQIRNLAYSLTVPGFSKNVLGVDSSVYRNSVSNILEKSQENVLDKHEETDGYDGSLL